MKTHSLLSLPQVTSRRAKGILAGSIAALAFLAGQTAPAASLVWDSDAAANGALGGTGTWDLSTLNWGNTVGTDVAWTDATTAGRDLAFFAGTAGTVTLGSNLSAFGLQFTTPGYTLGGGSTLTLGGGGIVVSAPPNGTTTITSGLTLAGSQAWNVSTGGTLAINGAITARVANSANSYILALNNNTNNGTGVYTSTTLANEGSTGIIGTWATYGSGTSTKYATISGGTISGLTGTPAATPANLTDTTGFVNYDLAAGSATGLTGSFSMNTIRLTGGGSTIDIGTVASNANTLTVNGLMNSGTGALTIQTSGATPTGGLIIGANRELDVLTPNAQNITINSAVKDSVGGASSVVHSGTGTLTLGSASNAFTGGLYVKSGNVTVNSAAAGGSGGIFLGDTSGNNNATLLFATNNTFTNTVTAVAGSTGNVLTFALNNNISATGAITLNNNLQLQWQSEGGETFNTTIGGTGTLFLRHTNSSGGNTGNLSGTVNMIGPIISVGTTSNNTAINAGVGSSVTSITQNAVHNASILALSGTNTYTGATNIQNGRLQFTTVAAWSQNFGGVAATPSPITANHGTSLIAGMGGAGRFTDAQIATLIANTTFGLNTGFGIDTSGANASTTTVFGSAGMPQNFLKVGANTLTLTGASTYTGTSTLVGGTTNLGVAESAGVSGPLGNGGIISFAGGTMQYTALNTSDYSSRIIKSGSAMAIDVNAQTVTFASPLASTNLAGLTLTSTAAGGKLILAAANNYLGATTITTGTLQVNNPRALQNTAVSINTGSTALTFNTGLGSVFIGGFNGNQSISLLDLGATAVNLNLGSYLVGGTATYSGSLGGGATASLTKGGGNALSAFTQTFNGLAATYTGATTINTGILNLDFSGGTAPVSNLLSSSSALAFGPAGQLNLQGKAALNNSQQFNGTTIQSGSATIQLVAGTTPGNAAVALGAITRNSGGVLNFSNIPVVPGTFTISATTTGGVTNNGVANLVTNNYNDGSNDTNTLGGILGPWATAGTGATLTYVQANAAGQIVAYTGGTAAADGAALVDTTGKVNYNLTLATGSVPATVSANTLRNIGSGGTTTPGATSFTVNGIMQAGTGGWTIATNAITIGAARELPIVGNTQSLTVSSPIRDSLAGASSVTVRSVGGTITLSGANTFTGGLTLSGGTLAVTGTDSNFGDAAGGITLNAGSLSATGSTTPVLIVSPGRTLTVAANSLVTLNSGSNSFYYAGNIAGGGGVNIGNNGGGATVLVGNNAMSGLSLSNDSLRIASDANIGGPNTPIALSGGFTLSIMGNTMHNLAGHTLSYSAGGSGQTIDIQSPANTFTLGQNLSTLGGGFGKSGPGTLLLTGNNSFTGGINANGGTLKLDITLGGMLNATNAVNAVGFAGGGTFHLVGYSTGSTNTALGNVTVNAGGGTLKVDNNGGTYNLILGTLGANTTNGASLNILPVGGGTSNITTTTQVLGMTNGILSGRYIYGTTGAADWAIVNPGTATNVQGNNGLISGLPSGLYTSLTTGGTADANNSLIAGTQTQGGATTTNSAKITTSGAGQSLTIGTSLSLTSGGLLFTGADDYTVTGGTLSAGIGSNATNTDLIVHAFGAGKLTINSVIANGVGASTLTKTGNGTLILGNTNTYTGQTFINGGVLSISANTQLSGTTTQVNINSGTLQATTTFSSGRAISLGGSGGTIDVTNGSILTISGTVSGGALTTTSSDTGSGVLVLTATNNSFGGGLNINSGTVRLGSSNALGVLNSAQATSATVGLNTVTFGSGTTPALQLNGFSPTVLGLSSATASAVVSNGIGSGTAPGAATLTVNLGDDQTYAGSIIQGTAGSGTVGNLSLVKGGGGGLTLTNASNSYTGTTWIQNSTLSVSTIGSVGLTGNLGAAGNTPGSPLTAPIQLGIGAAAATLRYTGTVAEDYSAPRDINLAGLQGGATLEQAGTTAIKFGNVFATPSLSTAVVGAANKTLFLQGSTAGTGEITGAIVDSTVTGGGSGITSVTKNGTGTWIVSGAGSTYSGATVINAGTLRVTGTISASSAQVNPGATIGGDGTIAGIQVNNGGTIAPGNSIGTLHTTTLLMSGGSTFTLEIGGAVSDQIQATAVSILNGSINLAVSLTSPATAPSYTILDGVNIDDSYAGGARFYFGAPSNLLNEGDTFNVGGQTFAITYFANGGEDVVLTVVPEPGAAVSLLGGLGMLLACGRRRRAGGE